MQAPVEQKPGSPEQSQDQGAPQCHEPETTTLWEQERRDDTHECKCPGDHETDQGKNVENLVHVRKGGP